MCAGRSDKHRSGTTNENAGDSAQPGGTGVDFASSTISAASLGSRTSAATAASAAVDTWETYVRVICVQGAQLVVAERDPVPAQTEQPRWVLTQPAERG